MQIRMSTEGVPPEGRPEYWRQCVRDVLNADCNVEPLHDRPLHLEASIYKLGSAILAEAQGTAMRIQRRADPQATHVNVLFNLMGTCIVRQDQRETEVAAGSYALFPVREAAQYEFCDQFRHFSLMLPEDHLGAIAPHWRNCLATALSSANDSAALFADFVQCLLARGATLESRSSKRIADSLACLLAAMLEADPNVAEDKSSRFELYHRQRIRRYIVDNLRNPLLNVDLIANGVGLSPRYVHRLFSGEANTLMEWVWIQRLERAARDLADTTAPPRSIGDIAYSWGFNDQAHFSRSFRKYFKVTPRDWRDGPRSTTGWVAAAANAAS